MTARKGTSKRSKPERPSLDANDVEAMKQAADDLLAALAKGRNGSESAPPPDTPDSRTNAREPASSSEIDVQVPKPDTAGQTSKEPPELAKRRHVLRQFAKDIRRAGVAGERRNAKIIYLALTSRLLAWDPPNERPVSLVPKGSSSTGKSIVPQTTLKFFPESAVIRLGTITDKYLYYEEESFEHKILLIPEWASIKDDRRIVEMLRTLVSEGVIVLGTVDVVEENGHSKRKSRRIPKKGPVGLLMTTTDAVIDAEMETRVLSISSDDSREQTRRVLQAIAKREREVESPVDFKKWQDFQRWLADHGETRTVIPFAEALAALFPDNAPRLRRDYPTLLCFIRAHAILHQESREKDEHGRIIATVWNDYAPVRELVADLIAESVDASVSTVDRQTVEAARALLAEQKEKGIGYVTPAAIFKRLDIHRSAGYARLNRVVLKGYLANESPKGERKRIVDGSPLPDEEGFLPLPHEVVRWCPVEAVEQTDGSTMHPEDSLSNCPARPVDPPEEAVQMQLNGAPSENDHREYTPVEWSDELQDFVPKREST